MRIWILIVILLIAFSDNVSAQEKTGNRWQFGVFITPKVDYRIIQSNGFDEMSRLVIKGRNERDEIRPGLDIGVACFLNRNDHWQLKTGFEYSKWGYKYNGFRVNEPDPTSGTGTYTITYFDRTTLIKYTFFKIPVGLRYNMPSSKGKFSPFFELNLKPAFPSTLFKNFDWYFTGSMSAGISFPVNFVDQIYFALGFDYFLKKFPDDVYNVHPYSIGLEIGYIFW